MKQITFGLAILLAGALLITSCVQDNFNLDVLSDEMETEPTLVLPLIYGFFDMDDLAEVLDAEDYSLEDEGGESYYLVYPDTISLPVMAHSCDIAFSIGNFLQVVDSIVSIVSDGGGCARAMLL